MTKIIIIIIIIFHFSSFPFDCSLTDSFYLLEHEDHWKPLIKRLQCDIYLVLIFDIKSSLHCCKLIRQITADQARLSVNNPCREGSENRIKNRERITLRLFSFNLPSRLSESELIWNWEVRHCPDLAVSAFRSLLVVHQPKPISKVSSNTKVR